MSTKFLVFLVFLTLYFIQIVCVPHYIFCTRGVPIENLPLHIDPGDTVDIWYQEAPVFEAVYGNLFAYINGYHVSIGLRDLTTLRNYTIEYDAYSQVANASVAHVITRPDGKRDLVWLNWGRICVMEFINDTYWNHNITKVTTINGTQFNKLMNWLPIYNTTYPFYQLWTVTDKFPFGTEYIRSSDCFDFAFGVLNFLYHNCSAKFIVPSVKRDMLVITSKAPKIVDFSEGTESRERIIDFYQSFDLKGSTALPDIVKFAIYLALEEKYMHVNGTYYLLEMVSPYVEIHYFSEDLQQ